MSPPPPRFFCGGLSPPLSTPPPSFFFLLPAGTLGVRLPLPRQWSPFAGPPLLCRAQSIHRRVPEVLALCVARNPCLRRPSSKECRASLPRILEQKEYPQMLQHLGLPENTSLSNLHCPP